MNLLKGVLVKLLSNSQQRWLLDIRNHLLDWYYWPRSQREITRLLQKINTIEEAVELLWEYQGGGFYRNLIPNQDRGELIALATRVQEVAPQIIVELGTRDGGSLLLWNQISSAKLIISIDLPGGIHGGGYPFQREKFYHKFNLRFPHIQQKLLRLDSQQESTKQKVVELLDGQPIDFLFIDADHRYPGVKRDYELYSDQVRPGGLIAFHDIRPNQYDETIQVHRLWEEIKAQEAKTEEIVHEPYTGRYGIGLLTK